MIWHIVLLCSFFSLQANFQLPEKHISVLVTSYNNINHYKENLKSIYTQDYHNYDVYYIDDYSTDGTGQAVKNTIKAMRLEEKIHLICNSRRQGKMKNVYNLIHSLPDDTIIVQVDGDDALAHPHVFKRINEIYSLQDIWLTYGQCKSLDSNKVHSAPVPQDVIAEGTFRKYHWVYTHLHTFYAWLFKSIRLADLLTDKTPHFEGCFHPAVDDVAFMTPMVEMARYHFRWISEILYLFNEENPISHWRRIHNLCILGTREILQKNSYPSLFQIPSYDSLDQTPDIFIFSDPTISDYDVSQYKNQIEKLMSGAGNYHYVKSNDPIEKLHIILELCSSNYVLFATYPHTPQQICDLTILSHTLHKTHGSAFYIELSDDLLQDPQFKYETIQDTLCCWKYSCNTFAKEYLVQSLLTLFDKNWLLPHLEQHLESITVEDFLKDTEKQGLDMDNVGLFFR